MGLLTRVAGFFSAQKATEGEYREGPYYLPITGGWLSAEAGSYANWWQMGYGVQRAGPTAMVEACVSAYAQTLAMCPGNHWALGDNGGRTRIGTSALARVLRRPNNYQSISDFLLNATRSLFLEGNAYALALRNNRYEISELHLMDPRACSPRIAATGEVFYELGGNQVVERMVGESIVVPARDVLHIRLHTPTHPLIGVTPITAAALQQAAGNAAMAQQIQFFVNQARPSFTLNTDQILTADQVNVIREKWNEQAKGMNQGGTPILTAGLKAQSLGVSSKDNQLIELLKLSDEAVATTLRVPHPLVGLSETPMGSTESLMQFWLASGLGFVLNHFEEAFGNLFGLYGQPDEYLEFDTGALLRSAFKDRVEAWTAGTKGGVFARNEARREFELPDVEGGDEPWVQQQDIPLSVAAENAKKPPPAPAPVPPPAADTPVDTPQPERGLPDGRITEAEVARILGAFDDEYELVRA